MKHNPNERWSIQKILKVFNKSIDYLPLTVSQATAMIETLFRDVWNCQIKMFHLIHFSPVSHFDTPWKRQKTGGIEMWHWTKMG